MVAAVVALLIGFGPRGFVAESPIQAFAVSPDGRRVACARDGNWFDIYDPATGTHVASGRASDGDQLGVLAFSPDGKTLAGGNPQSATVWLWDVATGEQHLSVSANPTGVRSLAFSPDGKRLACGGSEDGTVRVVDPTTRGLVYSLAVGDEAIRTVGAVGFDTAGRRLAAGAMPHNERGQVALCRVGDRPRVARLVPIQGIGASVTTGPVAVHPSGRVVFIPHGVSVRAVETATGRPRWTSREKLYVVQTVIADPAGRFVAGIVETGNVRVWDADTGDLVADWRPQVGATVGLAVGGDRLFTAGNDRAVFAWPWPAAPPQTKVRLLNSELANPVATLSGADTDSASHVIRWLADDPVAAVAHARNLLTAIPPPPAAAAKRVRALVRQLAVDDFDDRQAASRDLAALGPVIAPELRRALRATDDPEVTDRLAKLLREFDRADDAAEVVSARWLEVLERIGTPEAVAVVRAVAGGDPDHPRTEDAADTLARMTGGRKPGGRGEENRR